MTKNIAQEVAELTSEQKNNIANIHLKQLVGETLIITITLIVAIVSFVRFSIKENAANTTYVFLKENPSFSSISCEIIGDPTDEGSIPLESSQIQSNYNAQMKSLEERKEMNTLKWSSIIICGIFGLICLAVLHIFLKKKHPYYSEKKYRYLKKNKDINS